MTACKPPAFAKMDKRITLQAETQTTDDQGGFTTAWADVATVWASIEPLKGYERMVAARLDTHVSHRVTLRYRAGVTTAHRLAYQGRTFDIKEALNEGEANRYLKLLCAERAAAPVTWEGAADTWETINTPWEGIG